MVIFIVKLLAEERCGMEHGPKETGDGARWTGHWSDLTSRRHQSRWLMVATAFGNRSGRRATHGGERMVWEKSQMMEEE